MNATNPTPLFVIGMNRTGTKWLSNLLANHPDVVAVQHADHTGILETNAFHAWRDKFPDLSQRDEYVALVELWSRTDFFRISGAKAELFYRLEPRPRDAVEMLGVLMDDLARREGRRFWLQKVSPWSAREVFERFPQARFVTIGRDRMDTLRSTHFLITAGERPISARTIASHHLQERLLAEAERRGAVPVRFETLRADPEGEMKRVCQALGLDWDASLLDLPWARNTSFRTRDERDYAFGPAELRKVGGLGWILDRLPDRLLLGLRVLFRTRASPVVEGTFRQIGRERGLD